MKIENYKILISHLPLKEQCFTTKKSTWINDETNSSQRQELEKFFENSNEITISRQNIFDTTDTKELIFKTIFWGYPRGMRGNNFTEILQKLPKLVDILNELKEINNLSSNNFKNIIKQFKSISGLGISTYSKFLYFLNLKINNHPCLILDQRLINVFSNNKFPEFSDFQKINYINAPNAYVDYIKTTNQIAIENSTKGENIELFLFTFGNNIKPITI